VVWVCRFVVSSRGGSRFGAVVGWILGLMNFAGVEDLFGAVGGLFVVGFGRWTVRI